MVEQRYVALGAHGLEEHGVGAVAHVSEPVGQLVEVGLVFVAELLTLLDEVTEEHVGIAHVSE